MNSFTCMGRIASDLVLRKTTPSGTSVMNFSVAVSRRGKNDTTDFFRCTAYGKQAEQMEQMTEKGKRVLIEGALRTDSYEKDGRTNYVTYVAVNHITFIDYKQRSNVDAAAEMEYADMDLDIPF